MSRLIDADALMDVLGIADDCQYCQYQSSIFCNRSPDFVNACEAIADAPTIDAVEVVRCQDCRHTEEDKLFGGYWCKGVHHTGDWFCADGKRREEDETAD